MSAKLTPKQECFVTEYLVDLNATQAAIRAGYKPRSARTAAARNMSNDNIREAISAARQEQQERTEITADRVMQELARIALVDVRKLFDDEGNPLDISCIDDDTAAAISGLDVTKESDIDVYVKKIRMADKLRALELLGRHLGMFNGGGDGGMTQESGVVLLPTRGEG